jgi:hypothetical protein
MLFAGATATTQKHKASDAIFFTKFQFERIAFLKKKELLFPPCCLAFDRCIHWPGKLQVRREGSAQFDQVNPTKVEHVSTQRA